MNKSLEFLVTFLIQTIALMPLWLLGWHLIKRLKKAEVHIRALVDLNNHRAYYSAKKTIERYQDETLMSQDELKEFDEAKKIIAQFEKDYKVTDPENN